MGLGPLDGAADARARPGADDARPAAPFDSPDPNLLDIAVSDGGAIRVCALYSLASARELLAPDAPHHMVARTRAVWSAFGLGRRKKRLLLVVHRGAATYLSPEFNSIRGLLSEQAIPGVMFVPMAAWNVW